MSTRHSLTEAAGWYGTIAIITAFALASFDIIPATGWAFAILNLTGAIGFIIISVKKKVRQSIVLNVFWAVIAGISLLRLAMSA